MRAGGVILTPIYGYAWKYMVSRERYDMEGAITCASEQGSYKSIRLARDMRPERCYPRVRVSGVS
jgi:hypothetical protein